MVFIVKYSYSDNIKQDEGTVLETTVVILNLGT